MNLVKVTDNKNVYADVIHENPDEKALIMENNLFIGKIDKEVIQG